MNLLYWVKSAEAEGVAGWMVEVKESEASFLFFLSSNLNLAFLHL